MHIPGNQNGSTEGVRVAEHNATTPSTNETGENYIYIFFIIANNMTSSLVLVSNLICIYKVYIVFPSNPAHVIIVVQGGVNIGRGRGEAVLRPSMPDIDVCRVTMQLHYYLRVHISVWHRL